MGRPKALLRIGGRTFVERVVDALREAGCAPVLVVTNGDPEVARRAGDAGAEVIVNEDPGEGPITSLRIAVRRLPDGVDGIAYLPVDHPLVGPEIVAALLEQAELTGASLTLPVVGDKRGHPALLRRDLFPALLDPKLEGGARTVVHAHLEAGCMVPFEDPGPITDVDTPDAFAAALRTAAGGRSP